MTFCLGLRLLQVCWSILTFENLFTCSGARIINDFIIWHTFCTAIVIAFKKRTILWIGDLLLINSCKYWYTHARAGQTSKLLSQKAKQDKRLSNQWRKYKDCLKWRPKDCTERRKGKNDQNVQVVFRWKWNKDNTHSSKFFPVEVVCWTPVQASNGNGKNFNVSRPSYAK